MPYPRYEPQNSINNTVNETKFNIGLSNQMDIHDLLAASLRAALIGEPVSRARALVGVKHIIHSICDEKEQSKLKEAEESVKEWINCFLVYIGNNNIKLDPEMGYSGKIDSKFYDMQIKFMNLLDKFEEDLRIKLKPILFPTEPDDLSYDEL